VMQINDVDIYKRKYYMRSMDVSANNDQRSKKETKFELLQCNAMKKVNLSMSLHCQLLSSISFGRALSL
jgi:hypothetical protein